MAGATCGFVAPRRPWRWALAAGIWISIFAMFRSASPSALAMLIVVAFPLAGAYAGAAMRGALWKSPRRVDGHQVFHDKSRVFDFVVVSKRGWVNPELAAVVADPDTATRSLFGAHGACGARTAGPRPLTDAAR